MAETCISSRLLEEVTSAFWDERGLFGGEDDDSTSNRGEGCGTENAVIGVGRSKNGRPVWG